MRRKPSDGRAGRRAGGRRLALLVLLTASQAARLPAQEGPLNAGALVLAFPVGAQAVGMGQTATAASGHDGVAVWNPAGLAAVSDGELRLDPASLVAREAGVLGADVPVRGVGVPGRGLA